MDRYAVVGNPIAHSKSPLIHSMFAEQTGEQLSYEALLAPLDDFAGALRAFLQEGRGVNVTVRSRSRPGSWSTAVPPPLSWPVR